MNKNQQIRLLAWLMQLKARSAFTKPICRMALRIAYPHVRLLAPEDYFLAVTKAAGITPNFSLEHYREELLADELLKANYLGAIESGKLPQKYKNYSERFQRNANIVHYYALIRELAPEYLIETGTATGSMTSWVLKALHENKRGTLISIDLPPVANRLTMDITVAPDEVGFFIPELYKKHWDLRVGDAKILLPKVLAETPVNVFIHDSLHTITHMAFEYNVARALMKPGTIILSDDILWNHAWYKFLDTHNLTGFSCEDNANLGFTVNHFDSYEQQEGLGVMRVNA